MYVVESQTRNAWTEAYFTPVFSVLLYNLGDLTGRSLATWLQWPGRKARARYTLLAVAVVRIGELPRCDLSDTRMIERSLLSLYTL